MTKKGKRIALLQRTEQVAELQRENEQLRARLTAPEETDDKLSQSEQRYRLLADNASDVIWIADMDHNMTYVSPSAARMLGCGMNELMTPAVSDLLLPEAVRLRIKDFGDQVASEPRHPGCSARELTLETRLQLRDGSTLWVEQRIDFIRDDEGRLTGVMGITRDITDRREAEEELRASEARNRLLIENANEGIIVVQDEAVKFANPKFAGISGYRIEELISKPPLELFHPDDRQTIQGYYVRRIEGEQLPNVYPIRLLDKAGRTKWVEMNAVMLDWEGHPAVLALVTDLTERRAAQQALEESERKYRALAEESIQGLVVAQGLPPRFVYCNAAMAGMTGYTVEELVSMSPEQFAALIHPEDREIVFKRFTESPAGAATEEHLQFRGLRRDGREVWLEMAATTVEYQGAPAVQAALIDITERKKAEEALRASEEKFRQITENMLDAVSLVDKDGIIRYVSPSHERILGYKPEDLVGTSVFDPIFLEDRDGVMAALDVILEKREGGFQYRFRHSDGHYVWGEASARIMVDDDGNMLGAVIASRDITDRKKVEEALRDGEAKYRRLFESTQTAMEVISMETGLVVLANEAMAKLFGVASADDLVGIDSMQYLRPEDVDWISAKMAQAVADSSWREIEELQVRRADGRWTWVSGMVIQSEYQGKPALLVSLLDITSRRQAEETLRESEEKFRLLTERTNDMVWTTDLSLRTTYISPSVERLLGFTPEERIGVETSAQVTPESMARAEQLLLEQLELERGGTADPNRTLRIELEYYHKNGSAVWLEALVGGIRDENGTLVAVHGVSRDVSERRKAEQALRDSEAKYRRVFEGTHVGMEIISGETGLVVMANEAMARIFGFRSPGDVIGRPEKLAALMAGSETRAMRRLVAAGAYITLSRTDAGRAASEIQLKKLKTSGPPMARRTASLVEGLIAGKADGMAFLQELVP